MNKQEAKEHFKLTPATRPTRAFMLGKYLIHVTFAVDEWSKLDSELNLQTFFFHIGKVTNKEGLVLRKFIFWRLDVTWGRIDQ